MKARSAKNKGVRLQNYVAESIRNLLNLPTPDVKPAIMGETGVDIHLSSLALSRFPFSVECKNTEKASVWSWIKQAEENNIQGTIPLVVFKRNRSQPHVILSFENLLYLVQRMNKGDNDGKK